MATETRETVLLADLAWPDVRAARERGVDTIVVMTGSTEQHGPHLPVMTDHLLGHHLGERVARRLGNALLAPVVAVGCSEHHMAFAGSITLSRATFIAVVCDYVRSLARHGFRRFVLLSAHGGNFTALDEAAAILRTELPDVQVIAFSDGERFIAAMRAVAEPTGLSAGEVGSHAGEAETSMVLAVRPDLVRTGRYEPGLTDRPPGFREKLHREGMHAISPNGILGDPRRAEAARGDAYLQALADTIAAWAQGEFAGTGTSGRTRT